MTAASTLLLQLQPRPIAPSGGMSLSVLDPVPSALDGILEVTTPSSSLDWTSIIIHHSGQSRGNAATIGQIHQILGYGGLGYHFVIGNGDGADDGLIQIGYKWVKQLDGEYAHNAISICLVGNGDQTPPTQLQMNQLSRLVRFLQHHLNITDNRVYLHTNIAHTTSPGKFFPKDEFRSALASATP